MGHQRTQLLAAALALSFLGCGSEPGPLPLAPGETLFITDPANYNFSSKLKAAVQPLKEYGDSTISWVNLRQDMSGRTMDPVADVDTATLLLFPRLKPQEALDGLASDQIEQSDIGLYMVCTPSKATCKLSKFGLFGSFPGIHNFFQEGRGSWLVMLNKKGEKGGRAFTFIQPDARSTATEAVVQDSTSSLKMDVDLRTSARIRVRSDGDNKLDWASVSVDGLGNKISLYKLDLLTIMSDRLLPF